MEEVIKMIQNNFGEIGNLTIEEGSVFFEVYRGDYEDAPKQIISYCKKIKLKLVNKFDEQFFTLVYDIVIT